MFKQFTQNVQGNQVYLLASLGIFLLFFLVVSIMLMRSKKEHNTYMSDLPLNDQLAHPDNDLL